MPLPKIEKPIFTLNLPLSGEKIKYSPFTVREEKILLIARESKDLDQAITSMKQVINNCLIDKNVEDLSMIDLEYVLLNLRAKSVDNKVEFIVKDNDTDEDISLELDLDEIKIIIPENHTNEIRINEDFVLYMKYPTIDEFFDLLRKGIDNPEANYEIMLKCMDKLATEHDVHNFADETMEEINEFALDLTEDVIEKIKAFFETMPKLRHELHYKDKNGNDKTFVIEGVETFFI